MFWRIAVERATQWATLGLLRNNTLDARLKCDCENVSYDMEFIEIVEREWYDCCSSRHGVSGPIIPTVRLLQLDGYVSRGRSYIYVYVYILDCCSSMDNLGAGLLSTWIRKIFLEISQPNGQSELCDLRVRTFTILLQFLQPKNLYVLSLSYELLFVTLA